MLSYVQHCIHPPNVNIWEGLLICSVVLAVCQIVIFFDKQIFYLIDHDN